MRPELKSGLAETLRAIAWALDNDLDVTVHNCELKRDSERTSFDSGFVQFGPGRGRHMRLEISWTASPESRPSEDDDNPRIGAA